MRLVLELILQVAKLLLELYLEEKKKPKKVKVHGHDPKLQAAIDDSIAQSLGVLPTGQRS